MLFVRARRGRSGVRSTVRLACIVLVAAREHADKAQKCNKGQ
jgi:hypothetical protein